MELEHALHILADSHTRDDELTGFVVETGASHWTRWSGGQYIEAWKTVRAHLHREVRTRFEREEQERYKQTAENV